MPELQRRGLRRQPTPECHAYLCLWLHQRQAMSAYAKALLDTLAFGLVWAVILTFVVPLLAP